MAHYQTYNAQQTASTVDPATVNSALLAGVTAGITGNVTPPPAFAGHPALRRAWFDGTQRAEFSGAPRIFLPQLQDAPI